MRHTLAIPLAFLVISAGAIAKTPERPPSPPLANFYYGQGASCAQSRARPAVHHKQPSRHGEEASDPANDASGGPVDAYFGSLHPVGPMEIGSAAWYNWVGSRTASGEILDRITATAAHRSLPLASYAKVTNLDTGRSVVVKINDRGPWNRRFIIDLSPRAAQAIGVIRTGIAAVIVEPVSLLDQPPPTVAAFAASASAAVQ
jgi:rare lipoprotein A